MSTKTTSRWKRKRDKDSRRIERVLRAEFPATDAYRYNSASIRVRVVDERFRGKSPEERDAMVEPLLEQLPDRLQADVMNLITLYPDETAASLKAQLADAEFEDPSPSKL